MSGMQCHAVCPEVHPGLTWVTTTLNPRMRQRLKSGQVWGPGAVTTRLIPLHLGPKSKVLTKLQPAGPFPLSQHLKGWGTDQPGHSPHRTGIDSGTPACHCWARRVGLCSLTWVPGTGRGRHPVLVQEDQRGHDPALDAPADALGTNSLWAAPHGAQAPPGAHAAPWASPPLRPDTPQAAAWRPPSPGGLAGRSQPRAVRGSGPGGLRPAASGGRGLGRWRRHRQVGWLRGDRVTSGCRRGRAGSARRAQWNPRSGP